MEIHEKMLKLKISVVIFTDTKVGTQINNNIVEKRSVDSMINLRNIA